VRSLEATPLLPDYPRVKEKLMGVFLERMRRVEAENLGFLGGETLIQEGRRSTLHREDGSIQDVEIKSMEVTRRLDVDYRSLEDLKVSDILALYDSLATAIAEAKARHSFEVLSGELEKVGNVESSEKPIHEKLLSGFEKIELDFIDGQPVWPCFVANPNTTPVIQEALKHIFETPELMRRFRAIIAQKREQYRDREAARKLVE
jgi:hypothetical protein